MVGLFFFIRASTKDRIETLQVTLDRDPSQLQAELEQYFCDRAYNRVDLDEENRRVTLSGLVRPSLFLAVFLSGLAAIGAFCFALVLATLFPDYGYGFSILLLLSPGAGWFYWQRAGREERVTLTVQPPPDSDHAAKSQVTVIAHRDELTALRQNFLRA